MNDSLIEIALREMKSKRKPRTLAKIAKDVFEVKGIKAQEAEKALAQFQIDFMLSGHFICCGEDKYGIKLWDLKSRQPSSLLDKDGSYLEDLYSDDEEVIKNELNDDAVYSQALDKDFDDDFYDEDDEDEVTEETDEIEEELMSLEEDETEDEEEEFEIEDEDMEDEDDDLEEEDDERPKTFY